MAAPPNTNLGNKYPSMASVSSMQSLLSMGYLPPGHGYVPKKQKPDKPYGITFVSRMNRTARGPGRKYMNYALACLIAASLLLLGAAVFLGHRNVSRMIVYRNEVFGPLMVVTALCLISLMGHFVYKARVESNKWRANIRFYPEGLFTAAAYNDEYVPDLVISEQLISGTYGPKALKEIPKPKAAKKKKKKKRAQSKESLLSDDSLDSGTNTPRGPPIPVAPVAADPSLQYKRGHSMERILEEPTEEYPMPAGGDRPAYPLPSGGEEMLVEPIGYDYQQPQWGASGAPYQDMPGQPAYASGHPPQNVAPELLYATSQYATPHKVKAQQPVPSQYSLARGPDPTVHYSIPSNAFHTQQPQSWYTNPTQYQPPPGLEESEL